MGDSFATVPSPSSPLKVLICDNHQPTRNVTQILLSDEFETAIAETLEEALALAPQSHVILLNPDFFGRNRGTQLLQEIRSQDGGAELVAIAFTGHVHMSDIEKFLSSGYDAVQRKPFLRQQLIDTIHTAHQAKTASPEGQGPRAAGRG